MTSDLEKSFKAKIRNIAKEKSLNPAVLWQNLVLERFLVRMANSVYAKHFILKGGILLSKLIEIGRETKDLDFSVKGLGKEKEQIFEVMTAISETQVDDGFSFQDVAIEEIPHPHMKYPVVRVSMYGYFGKTRFRVFIDLGYGDWVHPKTGTLPLISSSKGVLFESTVEIQHYPVEFVFAEKLQTVIARYQENSRMKDFHDLYLMTQKENLFSEKFESVLRGVFEHRETPFALPINFSKEVVDRLQAYWDGHLRGLTKGHVMPNKLDDLVGIINAWLGEKIVLEA
ncbi:MAG: putative nucleotidyltransferase component of viral defense system [Chlamydiales bacterium]|jgi:predicted nucleotidyltransferase component of viral defense system